MGGSRRNVADVLVERVVLMVDASARVVAPEEHDDLFEEFAEDLRASGRIPGADSGHVDEAAPGIADTQADQAGNEAPGTPDPDAVRSPSG
ncbi:hypothetical protein [Streptomyces sp. NPDC005017]|uniref:hypothetical protein n=1 Tax=Streptomyces sp. NPDC005017 TaxID=3364706 RepID=UPI0036A2CA18